MLFSLRGGRTQRLLWRLVKSGATLDGENVTGPPPPGTAAGPPAGRVGPELRMRGRRPAAPAGNRAARSALEATVLGLQASSWVCSPPAWTTQRRDERNENFTSHRSRGTQITDLPRCPRQEYKRAGALPVPAVPMGAGASEVGRALEATASKVPDPGVIPFSFR